jgi:hypothetical protein
LNDFSLIVQDFFTKELNFSLITLEKKV